MQSDASSSSNKRSLSEPTSHDNDNTRPDELTTVPLTGNIDGNIDAYMAEQVEASDENSTNASSAERFKAIEKLKSSQMKVGETWYLVSNHWWKRFHKASIGLVDKEGIVEERDLGPVDNGSLLDEYNNLKRPLVEGVEVQYVPQEVWDELVKRHVWFLLFSYHFYSSIDSSYGKPQHILARKVISQGLLNQTTLEMHPPTLRVFRLLASNDVPDPDDVACTVTVSSKDTVEELRRSLCHALYPTDPPSVYRVWTLDTTNPDFDCSGRDIPLQLFQSCNPEFLDSSQKTFDDSMINSDDAFAVEIKQESGWIADLPGEKKDSVVPDAPLFSAESNFFSRMGNQNPAQTRFTTSFSTPVKTFPTKTYGSSSMRSKITEPGTLGLGNMQVPFGRTIICSNIVV